MIVIAGAGLAGLSTAYHLKDREYRIFERQARPGGLCRTELSGEYQFDYGGHLLHFRNDYVKNLVRELLGDNTKEIQRNSGIFSKDVLTDFPFQVNLHGLPPEVIRDCLLGFIEALKHAEKAAEPPPDYEGWILHTFGRGIAEHFMLPFNRKFWQVDLKEVLARELLWSIPRPELKDVIEGALGIANSGFGYNASFDYPRQGGIEALVKQFTARVGPVETSREIVEVIPAEKRCILKDGEEVSYDSLVSSMPLPELISRMHGAPAQIKDSAAGLRWVSVLCVNLGIEGPPITDRHWLYFPEEKIPFHRVGVYSNFFKAVQDRHSLYLEISGLPERFEGREGEFEKLAADAFEQSGLMRKANRISLVDHLKINYGYVIFDSHREKHLPGLLEYLRQQSILPIGRYGRWEYSTMEDAILEGQEAALEIIR